MKVIQEWLYILLRYIYRLVWVAIFSIVFGLLSAFDVVERLFPQYQLPRGLLLRLLFAAFLIANVIIFGQQERRIAKLQAGKTDALNAVIHEIAVNQASAAHNAGVRGLTNSPGALPLMRLSDDRCRETLLSGRLRFGKPSLSDAAENTGRQLTTSIL